MPPDCPQFGGFAIGMAGPGVSALNHEQQVIFYCPD
jgi:hypothetical protein